MGTGALGTGAPRPACWEPARRARRVGKRMRIAPPFPLLAIPLLFLAAQVPFLAVARAEDEAPDPVTQSHTSSDGAFRLDVREGRRGVSFELENLEAFPISVTLGIGVLENLSSDRALPLTQVVAAKATQRLARLEPKDSARSWRYERVRCGYQVGSVDAKPAEHVYELPYPPGRAYRLDQGFDGAFSHRGRCALDFALPAGALVTAARGGEVVKAIGTHEGGGAEERFRGLANRVWILHADGTFGCYAHFRAGGLKVEVGQIVKVGAPLGEAGATGYAQGPHLHFEVRVARRGKSQADTIPVQFRTVQGADILLEVGKTYQRPLGRAVEPQASAGEAPPQPPLPSNLIGGLELCREPTREAPSLERGRSGERLWARVVIEAPGAHQIELSLRRADHDPEPDSKPETQPEPVLWRHEIQLSARADRALQALPPQAQPGRYELVLRARGRVLARCAFSLD